MRRRQPCLARHLVASGSMRSALLIAVAALVLPSPAFATWSVLAVDRDTGRVVISSATCVDGDDQVLPGVQAVVVPGHGVAACQAAVDRTHTNQMLVFRELQKGTEPKTIIEMLSADPAFQSRQFGIVDITGRSAGHSGLGNGYVSQDQRDRTKLPRTRRARVGAAASLRLRDLRARRDA